MQELPAPSVGRYVASLVPFIFFLLVWVGAAGLLVWAVLLLRRISRSLDRIADTLARRERDGV